MARRGASETVYVGVYLARLELPWAQSLKEKRAVVKPVTERLKARFPVSVARLDGLNARGWEVIGATALSSDAVWLRQLLDSVDAFVRDMADCRVSMSRIELTPWPGLDEADEGLLGDDLLAG